MGCLKKLALLGGLAVWYAFTGPSSEQIKNKKPYPLPEEISVVETSLPYEERDIVTESIDQDGNKTTSVVGLEKVVKTSDIDFSEEFYIQTDRYNLVKKEEWLPSRLIGHTVSLPFKAYFLDWDIGWGLDEEKSKAVLSMLEDNENISDITVRINHNEAIYDCYRLFGDEQVRERNNFFARALVGVPLSICGELFAELRRGDYYNPMNQTAVLFSNVESISGHEIGHHQDFQRFDSDWEYSLSRAFPPAMLYQEWQASINSKDMLSNDDKGQFNRYLLPAFLTYLIGGYYLSRKVLQKQAMKSNGDDRDIDKIEESEKPHIHPFQTLRHFGTMNADLHAGILAYSALSAAAPILAPVGFVGAMIGTHKVADTLLKKVIPYEHETSFNYSTHT